MEQRKQRGPRNCKLLYLVFSAVSQFISRSLSRISLQLTFSDKSYYEGSFMNKFHGEGKVFGT